MKANTQNQIDKNYQLVIDEIERQAWLYRQKMETLQKAQESLANARKALKEATENNNKHFQF
jgi:DNA replication protein DnaD